MVLLLLPLLPTTVTPFILPYSSRQSTNNQSSQPPLFNLTTTLRNGTATPFFLSQLPILSPPNNTISLSTILPPNTTTTTISICFSNLTINTTSNTWTTLTTLRYIGPPGLINFTISAIANPSRVMYRANFRLLILGISVLTNNSILSTPDSPPYPLAAFQDWLQIPQLALPIRLQLPSSLSQSVVEQFRLRVLPQQIGPDTPDIVNAVNFDPIQCRISQPVSVRLGNDTADISRDRDEEVNTVFVNSDNSERFGFARLPPSCGLGLSSDLAWLIIRLEPYRVADYGFAVEIRWIGTSGSVVEEGKDENQDAFSAVIRFGFDKSFVPPPIVRNYSLVLDPFGGEYLRIPVENTLVPPQVAVLNASDFVLNLTTVDGVSQVLNADDINSLENTSLGEPREIVFNTPTWTDQSEEMLMSTLLYRTPTDVIEGDEEVRMNEAVIQPGESFEFSLASNKLASLSTCDQNPEVYERQNFLLFTLRLNQYSRETFSQYKNTLIKSHIAQSFPVLTQDAFRLVSIEDQLVQYAILIIRFGDIGAVLSQAETLRRSVIDGTLASRINAKIDNVNIEELRIVNGTLCVLYPSLEVNAGGILDGLVTRLIPLWVFLGFSLILFFCICCVACVRYLSVLEKSEYKSSTGDRISIPGNKVNDMSLEGENGEKFEDLIPVDTGSSMLESTDDEGQIMESPVRFAKRLISRLLSRNPDSGNHSGSGIDFIVPMDERNLTSPTVYAQTITEVSQ